MRGGEVILNEMKNLGLGRGQGNRPFLPAGRLALRSG